MDQNQKNRPFKSPLLPPRTLELLSAREWEVVNLVCDGLNKEQIASGLGISPDTVRNHLRSIRRKLNCPSLPELRILLANLRRPSLSQ